MFAQNLKANLMRLDADRLAAYVNHCFKLNRPDLAWPLVIRLASIDPNDPALSLAAARFGHVWFACRKTKIGLRARSVREMADLRQFYLLSRDVEPFRSFWQHVPSAWTMAITLPLAAITPA